MTIEIWYGAHNGDWGEGGGGGGGGYPFHLLVVQYSRPLLCRTEGNLDKPKV